ncbi:MAG: L-aspartate oxidase [Spirochaetales bacterium]|nr:L-aspartate oxidase [Spirochaetales bacterium]
MKANMNQIYDTIVIGTGIAGLTAAINLKEAGQNVIVLTKNDKISECNTNYAQGGIIAYRPDDSAEALEKDIFYAGCYYNNQQAVKTLANEGPKLVFDFLINKIGIQFSTNDAGQLDYTEEAAHSQRRILHYQDHTGDKIESSLIAYAQKIGIVILPGHTAIDLITNNHHSTDNQELYKPREVMGVYALNNATGDVITFFASNVILATGGVGNLFQYTTNPASATGDGISMAYRAGADIINAEFVQFHPTALFHKDLKRFLISESLRGEGAKLLNHNGEQFMSKYSPLKELAPRDVVARAIYEEINTTGKEYVLLDLAHYYTGTKPIEERFYKIYHTCKEVGLDITKDPIPVVPAAHFFCGGIKVDNNGRASIKNLYAVGEVSCTGLHGANRLASDSLLEGMLWGKRAADDIIATGTHIPNERFDKIPDWKQPADSIEFDKLLIYQDWNAIKLTMWNYTGIVRTHTGLARASADLNYYYHRIIKFYKEAKLNRDIIELRNGIVTAQIIVSAAIHNDKSLGCHFIKD